MSKRKNPPGFQATLTLNVTMSATNISDAVRKLQNWVYYLDRLQSRGVRLVPDALARPNHITLVTRNRDVAKKYGFHPIRTLVGEAARGMSEPCFPTEEKAALIVDAAEPQTYQQ